VVPQFAVRGMEPAGDDLAAFRADEVERVTKVVQSAGIKAE
jgi:hypothetical protein